MRGLAATVLAAAGLVLAGAAPAAQPVPLQKAALAALTRAVASGQIDRATAARDRAEINRAARLMRSLPSGRRERVATALAEVAAFAGRLTTPRAVALFGQLKANDDYFARHWAPRDKTDITDADGVVYRYFAGQCFQFHPLAEFAALNARVNAKDEEGTKRLAQALIARGVHQNGGVGWEYFFAFGGGTAPWLSGMAQAVAAQAFARAAAIVPDEEAAFMQAARGAYRVIPARLLTRVATGPWIRLYAFDSLAVLNAQLQTVVSLRAYATKADDDAAAKVAASLQESAAAMLPRFDTGYWTYYSLPGRPSPLHYQAYVVRLLTSLSSADPRFAAAATRFASYGRQPPAFKLAVGDAGQVSFWLSKPATVTAYSAAGPTKRLGLWGGWHSLRWNEPKQRGVYPIKVSAVDWAGNRASFDALPIVHVAGGATREAARTTAASSAGRPALSIGAGLDDPTQAARARKLGLRLVRVHVDWPGVPAPDSALAAAFVPLTGSDTLVELRASSIPTDEAELAALGQFAAELAPLVPGLRQLVLSPAPSAASASAYAAALTTVSDSVHAVLPDVRVGPLLDGATAPKASVAALGGALAPHDVVAFRPAPASGDGQWTAANVPQLVSALAQSFGAAPPIVIDGLAIATTIPAGEVGAYPVGQLPAPDAVAPRAQGAAYAATISAAACSTTVTGIILDRLVDSATEPTPPTGIAFAGGGWKTSAALVGAAAGPAQRGTVICPGLASSAAPSTLEFPVELDAASPPSVVLACTRDCLYLETLDDVNGRPVVARRGELRGGGRPLTLELPKVKLDGAFYRLDVRLVDRVNPGIVTRFRSPLLRVSPT